MSKSTNALPTAVLVHGTWSDGSSWNKVTRDLQARGFRVVAAQIPLTSFTDDIAAHIIRVFGTGAAVKAH